MTTPRYGWKPQNITDQQAQDDLEALKNYERFSLEKHSKGFQILREYVCFFGFNFVPACQAYDMNSSSLILNENFRSVLNTSKNQYFFTAEDVEDILTDSPHHFDGKSIFIKYQDFYQQISTYPPKTKYCLANIFGLRRKNPQDHLVPQWEKEIERMKKNFWDRKEKGEEWNFQIAELERLETGIMQTNNDRDADGDSGNRGDALESELYEKSIKNLYMMNNETILKNFDIKLAVMIAKIIKPINVVHFPDEQLEKVFHNNFVGKSRSKQIGITTNVLHHMFEEDFTSMMNDWFSEIKLTPDEMSLLFYRIWEDTNFGAFTYSTLLTWIIKNRQQKIRELRAIGLTEKQQKKILNKEQASSPKLFKELVKYAYSFGLNFLVTSLKPIIERDSYIMLNNIQLYFKSLSITFSGQDIDDLKFYLANHGAIHLQDSTGGGFLSADLLLDSTKLIDLITREAQKIAMHSIDFKEIGSKSKEQARRSVQGKIIQGVVNKLTIKLRGLSDDNDLIEEIKLRKTIADAFQEIDQTDLDLIFMKLQNVMMPSKYSSQRKIYLPEFIDFLLGGPLFDDDLFEQINNYEKQQRLKNLGLEDLPKQSTIPKNQEAEQSSNTMDSPEKQEEPSPKKNMKQLNLTSLESNKSDTQSGRMSGPVHIFEEKFSVVTKDSLVKQIQNQNKPTTEKRSGKVSLENEKIMGQTAKILTEKVDIAKLAQSTIDDRWTPDYRKVADDSLQPENRKKRENYMKGGFVLEEKEDSFAAKPINDRSLIIKLYNSLKQKIIVGQKQYLDDFDQLDAILLTLRYKLQAIDPSLRGVITSQQFYSFIKLNFSELTSQECYQLRNVAETYSGQEPTSDSPEINISYTYFCVHLHKFIASNILISPNQL